MTCRSTPTSTPTCRPTATSRSTSTPPQAVERGIAEIAITDHVDFVPGHAGLRRTRRSPTASGSSARPPSAGRRAASRSASGSRSRTTAPARPTSASTSRRHPYDYVIGIGPRLAGFAVPRDARRGLGRRPVARRDRRARTSRRSAAAIRSGLFDTIGHLDFVKRYLVPARHARRSSRPRRSSTSRSSPRSSRPGTALEVNTSGLRQAAARDVPGRGRSSSAIGCSGAPESSAGSDAHRTGSFAAGLEAGYRVVAAAGFGELAFRRGGSRVGVALPDRFRRGTVSRAAHLTSAGIPSL